MTYFALAVLLILASSALVFWVMLGSMPGRIARNRNHPQAEAISVCGWWGVITMGLLLPLAFIWAYSNPRWREESSTDGNSRGEGENT
jgi:hypothetical protein